LVTEAECVTSAPGVLAGIFSAAAFVISAFLFTYCVPIIVNGTSTGCAISHQLAATGFAGLGVALLILSVLLVIGPRQVLDKANAADARPSAESPGSPNAPLPVSCGNCGARSSDVATECWNCKRALPRIPPG
jgi:hypothetical protein